MKSNYLIIGCGNHGSRILDIFVKKKLPVVVVEKNQERIVELKILYSSNHQIIFVDSLEKGLVHLNDRYSCVLSNWANDRFSELIRLKNNGCNKVFLEVASNNLIAIHLYDKFGFKSFGIRKNYYSVSENKKVNAILMKKII